VELTNFFGAGAETTASTITWAYYFMVLHPDVQRKVQEEIDSKIDPNQMITMEDKRRSNIYTFCVTSLCKKSCFDSEIDLR
jgi:cytochrome P450